jgi:curli biogenesis system outer membrane secretion channel CsgG
MRIPRLVACLGLLFLMLCSSMALGAKGRRLIAVLDFDYSTVPNQWGETPLNLGSGLADMLVTELVRDGTYTVVEREHLRELMEEQELGLTSSFDPETAAEIGKLLGVQAVVIGSVTHFGTEKSTTVPPAAAQEVYEGVRGIRTHVQKALVGIDVRMISVDRGAVLVAASGEGEDRKASVVGGPYRQGPEGSDRSFSDISQELVGGAAEKAIMQLVSQLVEHSNKVPEIAITGLVAAVEGDTVVVNLGTADGVAEGSLLAVERVTKEVYDPADETKLLRRLTKRVATLRVTDVDEHSALAIVQTTGEGEVIDVGQRVTILDEP